MHCCLATIGCQICLPPLRRSIPCPPLERRVRPTDFSIHAPANCRGDCMYNSIPHSRFPAAEINIASNRQRQLLHGTAALCFNSARFPKFAFRVANAAARQRDYRDSSPGDGDSRVREAARASAVTVCHGLPWYQRGVKPPLRLGTPKRRPHNPATSRATA